MPRMLAADFITAGQEGEDDEARRYLGEDVSRRPRRITSAVSSSDDKLFQPTEIMQARSRSAIQAEPARISGRSWHEGKWPDRERLAKELRIEVFARPNMRPG